MKKLLDILNEVLEGTAKDAIDRQYPELSGKLEFSKIEPMSKYIDGDLALPSKPGWYIWYAKNRKVAMFVDEPENNNEVDHLTDDSLVLYVGEASNIKERFTTFGSAYIKANITSGGYEFGGEIGKILKFVKYFYSLDPDYLKIRGKSFKTYLESNVENASDIYEVGSEYDKKNISLFRNHFNSFLNSFSDKDIDLYRELKKNIIKWMGSNLYVRTITVSGDLESMFSKGKRGSYTGQNRRQIERVIGEAIGVNGLYFNTQSFETTVSDLIKSSEESETVVNPKSTQKPKSIKKDTQDQYTVYKIDLNGKGTHHYVKGDKTEEQIKKSVYNRNDSYGEKIRLGDIKVLSVVDSKEKAKEEINKLNGK